MHSGVKFLIKALLAIFVWKIVYVYIIYPYTTINTWLTTMVGETSVSLLRFGGNDAEFVNQRYVFINDIKSVIVDHSCNGLELFALFAGFMLISSGKVYARGLYLIVGILLIYIVNSLRIMLLGLNQIYNPESFEFNHKYLYLGAVYLLVILLWLLWTDVINREKSGGAKNS